MSDSPRPSDWRNDAATVRQTLGEDGPRWVATGCTVGFPPEQCEHCIAQAALARLVALLDQRTEALTEIADPKPGGSSAPEIARCALGWPSHLAGNEGTTPA